VRLARRRVVTYWAECTDAAESLRRLDQSSREALDAAGVELNRAALLRPGERRRALPDALRRFAAAWDDSRAALDQWDGADQSLRDGEAALERLRAACHYLETGHAH
jgi:hypothetical protein